MIVCGSAAWLQARAVGLGNAMEGCCDRVASSILRHVPCPLSVSSCHVDGEPAISRVTAPDSRVKCY